MRFMREVPQQGTASYTPQPIRLAWGAHVDDGFVSRLFDLCTGFDWTSDHANYLMACMAFESGRSFSPSVRNAAGSGATGLIQFMPATARGLSTTTDALAAMTAVQQLEYVERYFTPYHDRIESLSDMYMAILLPKYVGWPGGSVLFNDGTVAYRQNRGLDADTDGEITKDEAAGKVQRMLESGLRKSNAREVRPEGLIS